MSALKLTTISILIFSIIFKFYNIPQIYHQDEYKWAQIVDPKYNLFDTLPHPPLSKWLYRITGEIFGYNNLRILPVLFSIGVVFLGYLIMRKLFNHISAQIYVILASTNLAFFIGALQIDIDGMMLPFFSLLTWYIWLKAVDANYNNLFKVLLGISICLGFLTKLSFIIVPISFIMLYFISKLENVSTKNRMNLKFLLIMTTLVFSFIALLIFRYPNIFEYVTEFGILDFNSRSLSQVAYLTIKFLILLGPISFLASIEILKKNSNFLILKLFLINNVIFYYILFDFSHRTFDRYLLFATVPVIMFAALRLSKIYVDRIDYIGILYLLVIFAVTFLLLLRIPADPMPLYPKEDFVKAVTGFHWKFLMPIFTGSGPIGFYLSFFFIAIIFLFCALLCAVLISFNNFQKFITSIVVIVSILYSIVGISEYTTGIKYGSASKVAKLMLSEISSDSSILEVKTYNDIGGWELGEAKKYQGRIYLNPEWAIEKNRNFKTFEGFVLVVNMPEIRNDNWFAKALREKCTIQRETVDKLISGKLYKCRSLTANEKKE